MPLEIKIFLYAVLTVYLFLNDNLIIFTVIFVVMSFFLIRIPYQYLKKGWVPITLFLSFTFLSNIFFQKGRILYKIGSFVITDEGLQMAYIRTVRIFIMIAGAKILTSTTQPEDFVNALGNIFKPLERIGVPVRKFFLTMGLTIKYLPIIKDQIAENYRKKIKNERVESFWNRAKVYQTFYCLFYNKHTEP
ncbi:MAG: hypothetical protein HXY53_00230 [Nitrospirae bacterium]|nr:hypothetical protein [Nitrospirota bacterium]